MYQGGLINKLLKEYLRGRVYNARDIYHLRSYLTHHLPTGVKIEIEDGVLTITYTMEKEEDNVVFSSILI